MKNAELKEAVAKYIESKELVLMGYSPEYIDDVKNDMEVAFRAGAEWMAGQGVSMLGKVGIYGVDVESITKELREAGFNLGEEIILQIRKKQ